MSGFLKISTWDRMRSLKLTCYYWYCSQSSFGDESTPLHKATAGGRYLAVYMILEALKERDAILGKQSPTPKMSWLERGLRAKDRFGRTALDVAYHFLQIQNTERDAVARWDTVAGGSADWGKCVRLLENASENGAMQSKILNQDEQHLLSEGKAQHDSFCVHAEF